MLHLVKGVQVAFLFPHLRIFGGRFILPCWYCHEMADKRSSDVALQYPKLPNQFSPPRPHFFERSQQSVDLVKSTQKPEYAASRDDSKQAAWWGVQLFSLETIELGSVELPQSWIGRMRNLTSWRTVGCEEPHKKKRPYGKLMEDVCSSETKIC